MKIKVGLIFLLVFAVMGTISYAASTATQEVARKFLRPQLALEGGYLGGAVGAKAGVTINREILQMLPRVSFGYGIGQNYGLTLVQLELANYDNPYIFGFTLDVATYSLRVIGIPGLPDNIMEKGTKVGVGGFVGRKIRGLDLKLGYSSSLGYVVTLGKQIELKSPAEKNKK